MPIEPAYQETGPQADAFVARTKQSQGVFSVSQAVLTRYAQKLVEVARIIKENTYDIVLCPMRGARMPGLQSNRTREPVQRIGPSPYLFLALSPNPIGRRFTGRV